jgi:lipoyl(octanoyl) transferase
LIHPFPPVKVRVRDLGRMAYAEAFALQKQLQKEVIDARDAGSGVTGLIHLLLVEHDPPVITVSRRAGAKLHLLATAAQLAAAGVEVAETDRGGDITYHGPGQLVVYPILDLNRFGFRINTYMRFLEQIVIDTLSHFGIAGERDKDATGVWVRSGASTSKICAFGVRIARWVSLHGLALNVTTNLEHFKFIVPCGLTGRGVTSMQELGKSCPSLDHVKRAIVERFELELARHQSQGPATSVLRRG